MKYVEVAMVMGVGMQMLDSIMNIQLGPTEKYGLGETNYQGVQLLVKQVIAYTLVQHRNKRRWKSTVDLYRNEIDFSVANQRYIYRLH